MAKLSKEAWIQAFFEVMKEKPPRSEKAVEGAGETLRKHQADADKALKAARQALKDAEVRAEDAERKRYGAGVELDEVRRKSLTKEGRDSAQKDYDEAAERARQAQAVVAEAKLALKQAGFRAKEVSAQVEELGRRSKKGDFDGLKGELAEIMMHAELAERLQVEQMMVDEVAGRVKELESQLQEAVARHDVRAANQLEGDLASRREVMEGRQARRDAVAALMPGYQIAPVAKSATAELEEQVKVLGGAVAAAKRADDEAARVREDSRNQREAASDQLELAAQGDAKLKPLHEALTALRGQVLEAEKDIAGMREQLGDLQERLQKHQALIEKYSAGDPGAPGGQDIGASMQIVNGTVPYIAQYKGSLRARQDELRALQRQAVQARRELADAVSQRLEEGDASPALKEAQRVLDAAEATLRRAEESQRRAEQEMQLLSQRGQEATRRLAVAKTLPQATITGQEFNKALKGVEDFPIWEGSSELQKKLGPKRYEELLKLGVKLTGEFQSLVDNGATFEELREVYKDTPELWLPPRFREEEKNWISMHSLIDEETEDKFKKETSARLEKVNEKIEGFKSKLETGETLFGKAKEGIEYGEKGPEILSKVAESLASTKELSEKFESVLGLAAKLTTVIAAPLKMVESGGKSMETEDPVEALMLQEEFLESLGSLVEGLTGSIKGMKEVNKTFDIGSVVVKQVAALLPGIGVATNFAEVMSSLVASAARIDEAIRDAESHDLAMQEGHRAETAIDQFARRDKHLAARAATKTGIAMIKTAGSVVELSGVGAAVGKGLQGVATGIGVAKTVGEQIVDRQEGEKARELLDRAQAGDGHARSELFRFHPRYAKGILAIMADEGDALALQVLSTHGLSEDMIRRSSPKIVKRYLLKKFGESDDPPSWTSAREAVKGKIEAVGDLIESIDGAIGQLADKYLARFDSNDMVRAQAALSALQYDLQSQADISGAMSALAEVRVRRDALAEEATDEQAKDLQAIDLLLADELKKVAKLRESVLASFGQVGDVLKTLLSRPKNPLRDKAEAAARAVMLEHLQRIDTLAAAG